MSTEEICCEKQDEPPDPAKNEDFLQQENGFIIQEDIFKCSGKKTDEKDDVKTDADLWPDAKFSSAENLLVVPDSNFSPRRVELLQPDSFDEHLHHYRMNLCHTKICMLPPKDYHEEARALKDIQKFLDNPVILFKTTSTIWEVIMKEMLHKLHDVKCNVKLDIEAALESVISYQGVYVIPECIQSIVEGNQGPITDQSFVVAIGNTLAVSENQVVLCRLSQPVNFGRGAEGVQIICLVLSPMRTKQTKSGVQVARTYATLLSDVTLRQRLLDARSPDDFADTFKTENSRIHKEHELWKNTVSRRNSIEMLSKEVDKGRWFPGKDLIADAKRRARFYMSDFTKDVHDCLSIQKIISATLFLYFSLLLPVIAFGVLYAKVTDGKLDVRNVIVSQAFAGILWVFFSGQHLVVVRTTIPVIIYTKVIYTISKNWADDGSFFYTFYSMVGFSNAFFLIMYGVTGASKVMKYCTRSTDEILSFFISIAFIVDTVKYVFKEVHQYYCFPEDEFPSNGTAKGSSYYMEKCSPAKPILVLFLVCLTVFVGIRIFNFKYSKYLTTARRAFVADYAIVIAVALGTFVGSFVFARVQLKKFSINEENGFLELVDFKEPPAFAILSAIGLGFIMSILFFMESNISASMVNSPANKLKKGLSYHYDMVVLGVLNALLSMLGLPFVHGSLPHSPLHVRALADVEEHIEAGYVHQDIVRVRETRLTTLFSQMLIALSVLLVPYPLNVIPIPVLYGLFTYLAITALKDLQLWERMVLILTEQSLYPPLHYVRKVPQKIIHSFTVVQLVQLCVLCLVSFAGSAYLKMVFPFIIVLLIPIRSLVLPKLIPSRFLSALDGD